MGNKTRPEIKGYNEFLEAIKAQQTDYTPVLRAEYENALKNASSADMKKFVDFYFPQNGWLCSLWPRCAFERMGRRIISRHEK
ncbi:hypothetical protein [Mucilaginibacter rubeus]|uniref:Uncharacterized protein n=1 Tax=Mucilaginibacter rubeus TaxID=2027860 RepID=A0A5C1I6A9_9SPHI|nr:hypothetical protein [Mucilaginibacter rubeus]QEM13463.1 hypothetical protein DEO27_026785 [Mucilaginibacter rubeus]